MADAKDSLLNPLNISEAEARCKAALKVAREYKGVLHERCRRSPPDYIGASLDGFEALCKIIGTLDNGSTP